MGMRRHVCTGYKKEQSAPRSKNRRDRITASSEWQERAAFFIFIFIFLFFIFFKLLYPAKGLKSVKWINWTWLR